MTDRLEIRPNNQWPTSERAWFGTAIGVFTFPIASYLEAAVELGLLFGHNWFTLWFHLLDTTWQKHKATVKRLPGQCLFRDCWCIVRISLWRGRSMQWVQLVFPRFFHSQFCPTSFCSRSKAHGYKLHAKEGLLAVTATNHLFQLSPRPALLITVAIIGRSHMLLILAVRPLP